jgi:hypothetical protein
MLDLAGLVDSPMSPGVWVPLARSLRIDATARPGHRAEVWHAVIVDIDSAFPDQPDRGPGARSLV